MLEWRLKAGKSKTQFQLSFLIFFYVLLFYCFFSRLLLLLLFLLLLLLLVVVFLLFLLFLGNGLKGDNDLCKGTTLCSGTLLQETQQEGKSAYQVLFVIKVNW